MGPGQCVDTGRPVTFRVGVDERGVVTEAENTPAKVPDSTRSGKLWGLRFMWGPWGDTFGSKSVFDTIVGRAADELMTLRRDGVLSD